MSEDTGPTLKRGFQMRALLMNNGITLSDALVERAVNVVRDLEKRHKNLSIEIIRGEELRDRGMGGELSRFSLSWSSLLPYCLQVAPSHNLLCYVIFTLHTHLSHPLHTSPLSLS